MHDTSFCWKNTDTMEVGNSSKKYFFVNVDLVARNYIINFVGFPVNLDGWFNRLLIDANKFAAEWIWHLKSFVD